MQDFSIRGVDHRQGMDAVCAVEDRRIRPSPDLQVLRVDTTGLGARRGRIARERATTHDDSDHTS